MYFFNPKQAYHLFLTRTLPIIYDFNMLSNAWNKSTVRFHHYQYDNPLLSLQSTAPALNKFKKETSNVTCSPFIECTQ